MEPLGRFVLIEPSNREEKTSGGLIIPVGEDDGLLAMGRIIAVGPECVEEHRPSIDSNVLYFRNKSIEYGGDVLVTLEDLVAVVK